MHAKALDPSIPVVVGSRGAGKSFWSGVLGQDETRQAAAIAYPRLGLDKLRVAFGFTGAVGGPNGISVDHLNECVPDNANISQAKDFWWATILVAAERARGKKPKLKDLIKIASDFEARESAVSEIEEDFSSNKTTLLVVYDALDTISNEWPRRRLLTEAFFQVMWAVRAYARLKIKVFMRPDQIDDDSLKFVELPKLRTGAVRLEWKTQDLYGLLFSRLALSPDGGDALNKLLAELSQSNATPESILKRNWVLTSDEEQQSRAMSILAGPYMGPGPNGYKKGKTYDWPIKHLGDAYEEVTPRSFIGLIVAAASYGSIPQDRAITPDGIRHGLRNASKTRVDQLHLEFPWIKGVLAPLAGLLLPQSERQVYRVWQQAKTVKMVVNDASRRGYLPPFDNNSEPNEVGLFLALRRIGVMFRRKDDRLDMPDLFRVAAKLLKKGSTAPISS